MQGAQITIGVDGNSKIAVQFVGDENALLLLIGGVDYAKAQLINRIRQRTGDMMWGTPDGVTKVPVVPEPESILDFIEKEYPNEEKMPKNKAIEATEYAIQSLQLRVEQMKKSPDNAEFCINPSLLQQL